ncbi:MAG: hypothetical protein AAF616_03555 [Bacteroidota bacterium]
MILRISFSAILVISIVFFLVSFIETEENERIHGVCIVNPPRPIEAAKVGELHAINAEWMAVIPYGFSRAGLPEVSFDHTGQWWGEKTDGNTELIKFGKQYGLKIMCKPHVWVRGQGWAGDFDLVSESEWQKWEVMYMKYILHHASAAEQLNVELFCIGTEYRIPARERPFFWRKLIQEVRKVYSGKVTYAANWDNYEQIEWWDDVDVIGVDAYFPLVEAKDPSIDEIKNGWEPIKAKLEAFSAKWDKKILFTEYGFQSIDGATGNHWEVDKSTIAVNLQLQANAFDATFQSLENENWFLGGFFWKWHFNIGTDDWYKKEWTPQNKPALEVITKWYGK